MLEEINGQWQLDENGYVTYQKVVDCLNLNKTELYNRAMDYFVYNYGDVNSVIQNRDVVNGIIIGKGIFKNVHVLNGVLLSNIIDTWHILKVEVKDGRARITISLTHYDETVKGGELPDNHYLYPISEQYPINPKGYQKNLYEQAFYKSHLKALETIDLVERALKEGSVTKKDEW
ncbi:MAG: DUF4468 domain-containing protein [Bacteroidales bacterium]|nr:DUF4468 domain-containing protein [Bacteroidales bacterium]